VRQTANTKDTKEQVVAGVVDFTPLESDKAESGDKESLSRVVQAKMAVSSPSDPFEIEAEKVAADFVKRSYDPGSGGGVGISRSITPLVARRASGDGLENSGAGLETSAEAAQKISRATASGGRPLDGATRSRFEDGLGADLSSVKVHTDAQSDTLCRSLSADAFSTGRDVFFSSGTFSPGTKSGDHLLAHELTHVVQQGAAPTIARSKAPASAGQAEEGSVFRLTVGRANDPSEDLADAMADDAVASLRRSASRPGTVHRKAADPKDPLGGTQVDDGIERSINSQRGKGAKLGDREAAHFSESYGTDLSGVRVHTDSTADALSRSLQATAFTTGSDVFFSKGSYKPGTADGDHLIGHELAHVATAGGGGAAQRVQRKIDPGFLGGGIPVFGNVLSKEKFLEGVPSIASKIPWTYDPPQRQQIADLLAEYNKIKGKMALQVDKLDQGLAVLNGLAEVIDSYFKDDKIKKDVRQSDPLTDLLKVVKKVQADVQSRRLDKGRSEEVKENALASKYTKYDPSKNETLFSKVGKLLGSQVEEGKTAEFEIELEIPFGVQTLDAKLAATAEYDNEKYKLRTQIQVGGSAAKIPGIAKISATLGGYLESQAKDARLAGDLLGYALYRRLAESDVIPAEAQYYMFGTAGRDGKESSEANMAFIEQLAFGGDADPDTYAESGGIFEIEAKASGKLNPVKGLSGSIAATGGSRTDKKSLAMNNIEAGGKKKKESGLVSALSLGERGAEKTTGRTIGGIDAKIAFNKKPYNVEGEYSIRWIDMGANEKGESIDDVDTHELGFTVTFPKKAHDSFDQIKDITEMVTNLVQGHAKVAAAKSKKEKTKAFFEDQMGPLLGQAGSKLTDKAKEAASEAATEAAYAAAMENGTDLKGRVQDGLSAVGYDSSEEKAIAVTIDFTKGKVDLDFVEVEEKSLNLFGIKATMKKTSKDGYNLRKGKPEKKEEEKK
jgi:hypothetical protein